MGICNGYMRLTVAYLKDIQDRYESNFQQRMVRNLPKRSDTMLHEKSLDADAILFDFEGTLVDFQWQLAAAIEETLEMLWEMGFPPERILSRKYSTLLTEAMQAAPEIGLSPEEVRERIGAIYDRYDADALTRWALRPFVRDSLAAIKSKGIRTALVSNLGGKTLAAALSKFRLADYFDIVLSRYDVKNLKPSPEGLHCALAKLGVSLDACIFVGDSLDDVNAAKKAGIRVMIITAGENATEDILAAQPDYVIQSYKELLLLL